MNLKKEILDFINTKTEWNDLAKIYYIYIKVCQVFSYDFRYLYGTEEEKERIYQKRLNINNIEEFEIVCSSLCHVIKDLLNEISISSIISYDVLPHVFLIVELPPYKIKMDPMKNGYDLTRIKLENRTYGFIDLNNNNHFIEQINEFATEIYGKYNMFTDDCIKMLRKELDASNMFQNRLSNSSFHDDIFKEKIELIEMLINNTKKVKRYDDYDRYLDYLNVKLMTDWEQSKIHKNPFWQAQNGEWKVLDLILYEYQDNVPVCYKLSETNNKYQMELINTDEMNYYLSNYEGKIKGIYRSLTM